MHLVFIRGLGAVESLCDTGRIDGLLPVHSSQAEYPYTSLTHYLPAAHRLDQYHPDPAYHTWLQLKNLEALGALPLL